MVNNGYQKDDKRIIDYQLWPIPGTKFSIRGPKQSELPHRYFVAIGAAQTFGRFVDEPYPYLLEKVLDIPCLNLGFSGAGPSFFAKNPALMDVIDGAEFVIVQMMSGRSVENSVFELGVNQGTLRKIGENPLNNNFAEDEYLKLLKSESPEFLVRLRAEIKDRYAREMIDLLNRITPPKTLLYWSARTPEYREGISGIGDYWGGFPHFVTRDVIDRIKAHADSYVEVVTARGLPQPLFDKSTGEPVVLWDEKKFPNVKLRAHNHYYPSPEMHKDVADALLRNPIPLRGERKRSSTSLRPIVLHCHIFKNAGSSIDEALRLCFGNNWCSWDPEDPQQLLYDKDIVNFLEQNPTIQALSSHQLRPPFVGNARVQLFPIVFLRHPILRVESIYAFERFPERKATSQIPHTIKANELSFAEFVEWALSNPKSAIPISNYQVLVLSRAQTIRNRGDWNVMVTGEELFEATTFLSSIPVVGVVDQFERSAIALTRWLNPVFPGIKFTNAKVNQSRFVGQSTKEQLDQIQTKLGKPLFERLVKANEYDLELYYRSVERLSRSA